MLDTYARRVLTPVLKLLAQGLRRLHLGPNQVTLAALFFGLAGALLLACALPWPSLILLWLSGLLDTLDGELARMSGQQSKRGAFLDLICDRMVEVAYLAAFAIQGATAMPALLAMACAIILSISIFLSTGALSPPSGEKAFYYQAGLMERTEGFILFSLMMVIPAWSTALGGIYAGLVLFTAGQRFIEAWRRLA